MGELRSFRVGILAQPLGKLAQPSIARTFVSSFKRAIWSISWNELDEFYGLPTLGMVWTNSGALCFSRRSSPALSLVRHPSSRRLIATAHAFYSLGQLGYFRGMDRWVILELHPVGVVSPFLAGFRCSYLPPGGLGYFGTSSALQTRFQ